MSRKITLCLIAAGLFAATGAVVSAGHASASASDTYRKCGNDSFSKVLTCCQASVETRRPLWMRMGHQDCNSAGVIVCKGGGSSNGLSLTHVASASKPRCYIVKTQTEADNRHDPKSQGGGKGRTQ